MIQSSVTHKEQQENSLKVAYKKAAEILLSMEPAEVCERTGAVIEDSSYNIRFIDTTYRIVIPQVEFREKIPLILQVLILHYLTERNGPASSEALVNFSSIPGGMFYFESFKRRVLDKLVREFGEEPERLTDAAEKLGGRSWEKGIGVFIPLFPRIDAVVQVYPEDEEFPSSANFLFTGTVGSFLPVEDIAFMGNYAAGMLIRALS